MRLGTIAFILALAFSVQGARAELGLTLSHDAEHRLVLTQSPATMQAELVGIAENDTPLFGPADCATLGARYFETARAKALSIEVIIARYNIVNVWTGNLCPEGSDLSVEPLEARAWLDELAGLRRAEDDAPFIDARRRLAEVLTFGAPGVSPDYSAARRYLAQEAGSDPHMLLYLAYLAGNGLGGRPDQAETLDHLRRASERGSAEAAALLAQAHELGLLGLARDEAEAFARYSQVAQSVNPHVWFRLGLMLLEGRGGPRDPCRAQDLLERALGHAWSPIAEARPYLDAIRQQGLCRDPRTPRD